MLHERASRMRAPLVAAGLALAAAVMLAVVDPHQPGRYPPCPWHALTGLWCPACGGLRATHDLATGEPVAAVASNALVVALVPVVGVLWWGWLRQRWRGESTAPPTLSARATVVLVVVAAVFTIARNLPAGAVLAP